MALLTRKSDLSPLIQENEAPALLAETFAGSISQIIEQTSDSVLVTGRLGRIEYANPAFEQLTGYSRAEVTGLNPRLLKSGLHEESFYRRLWGAIQQGETFISEITNRKKNGELYRSMLTITPWHDTQGEISHFIVTGKEIDERELEHAHIHQLEQSILHTLDHMQAGCLLIDFNWAYRYVNRAAAHQLHARREDLLGQRLMEVQPGIEQTPLFARYHECLVQRIPQHFEAENPFPYGAQGWYEFRVELAVEGILVLTSDITACKQAELTLQQLNGTLRESATGRGAKASQRAPGE